MLNISSAMKYGSLHDSAMSSLIELQVAGFERLGQRQRLLEGHGQTFAGNRVHRTGGLADQRQVFPADQRQLSRGSDRAEHSGERLGPAKAFGNPGKCGRASSKLKRRFGGEQRHANLVGGDRSNVHLAVLAPVNFNEI